MGIELVWFRGAAQQKGITLFSSTAISNVSGRAGGWKEYRLPHANASCTFNEDGYQRGYLHNLYSEVLDYGTIHEFIEAMYPGIEPYHAWVGYSKFHRALDDSDHAVDWYIQHPAEYLGSWYQHYVLMDITLPHQYWQSSVSKHIGTKFFQDVDDELVYWVEATVIRGTDSCVTVWR
jgi:hypothetical protein